MHEKKEQNKKEECDNILAQRFIKHLKKKEIEEGVKIELEAFRIPHPHQMIIHHNGTTTKKCFY